MDRNIQIKFAVLQEAEYHSLASSSHSKWDKRRAKQTYSSKIMTGIKTKQHHAIKVVLHAYTHILGFNFKERISGAF